MIKTALVSGSANRIGAQIIKTLHNNNYNVIIHYKSSKTQADLLGATLNNIRKNSAKTLYADLSNNNDINILADNIDTIDLLVNNASSFYPTPFLEATIDDWNNLLNQNIRCAFFLSQALCPKLQKNLGNIINIADIHANIPLKNHSIYNIAKASIVMLSKTLAKDLAPDIRVNTIAPGAILWPKNGMSLQQKQKILKKIPLNRQGTPEDIANAVLFFANSAYITGQILAVDGGRSLNQ